jgi:DTW domain-containing protein YfiP
LKLAIVRLAVHVPLAARALKSRLFLLIRTRPAHMLPLVLRALEELLAAFRIASRRSAYCACEVTIATFMDYFVRVGDSVERSLAYFLARGTFLLYCSPAFLTQETIAVCGSMVDCSSRLQLAATVAACSNSIVVARISRS